MPNRLALSGRILEEGVFGQAARDPATIAVDE